MKRTRERLVADDVKLSPVLFYRHLAAYEFCLPYVMKKRVLDLGCGDGYGSYLLAEKARKVVGLDINEQMINKAAKNYQAENLKFKVGSALALPRLEKFDVVISLQLIEHIVDTDLYLNLLRKILKNGGKAIFSTPNRELRLGKGEKPWNRFHVREYDAPEFQCVLTEHFLKVTILGLQAVPEIYKLEKRRLYLRRIIAKLDVLQLYQHIPKEPTDWMLERFKKKTRQISSSDFWASKENIENALDLVAVCET